MEVYILLEKKVCIHSKSRRMTIAYVAMLIEESRESLPNFQLVIGLMVEFQLSEQNKLHMRKEMHRL